MSSRLLKPDRDADVVLKACLDRLPPQSFTMLAGAGSGKTTSLVKALHHAIKGKGPIAKRLKHGQKVACITYTEVAAKEIWQDVGNDFQANVSTIHSFLWQIIAPFQRDIKKWVVSRIDQKISDLETKAAGFTSRVQANTREKNAKDRLKYQAHKQKVTHVAHFNYGTGSNYSEGILGHDDIIKMVPDLIDSHPLLRTIIAQKFPIIFIDESQDTMPAIVKSLKEISKSNPEICIGFFGDAMQKIYMTGIGDVATETGWASITKPENFRCSTQVLNVINAIRKSGDGLEQTPGKEADERIEGSAQIFILPADAHRSERIDEVKQFIADLNSDPLWSSEEVKLLVLVHRMAATRLGFPDLYSAMNDNAPSEFKDGLLEGSAWPLKPFLNFVIPLVTALKQNDQFAVISILRDMCPLLDKTTLKEKKISEILSTIKGEVDKLSALMESGKILQILLLLKEKNLYALDERFYPFLAPTVSKEETIIEIDDEEREKYEQLQNSMKSFLACGANQLWGYKKYIDDESPFSTQHGIKGAEFKRVLTVLDDEEGTHNHFSYDKYFGIEPLSDADKKNVKDKKETSIDRTRKLFYVCCSRAEQDLVVIYFVANVGLALEKVRESKIFDSRCIYTLKELQAKKN